MDHQHILPATKRLTTSSRTSYSSSCSSTSSTGSNDSDTGNFYSTTDDCEGNSRHGGYYQHQEDLCTPKELLPMNGARRGKWTFEEERFTERIIEDFSTGILDLKQGTTLRNFLSSALNCDPMRITKKYTGDYSIGKRVFLGANLASFSPEFLQSRRMELQRLKETWYKALIRAEKERMEQFSEKGKLGKMSCFLADPSSSSADGHFNVCRIESVLIATDLSSEEIRRTVEWLKKAQSNLTNNNENIDDLNKTILEGDTFVPGLKFKVKTFVDSGQPMNLIQSQIYYQQQQRLLLQEQQQYHQHDQDGELCMTDSANSLTDLESSCNSVQSTCDNGSDRCMGDVYDKSDDLYYTPINTKKRPREFLTLSAIEQMEIERTAGLLMGFGVPVA